METETVRAENDSADVHAKLNPSFLPLYFKDHRYLLLKGGAGSGKSHFAAQKFVIRAMTEPDHKLVALRKYTPYVRLSCYPLIQSYLDKYQARYHPNKTEGIFELSNKNQIICRGLDIPEKIKSIEGATGFWFEEATEFTRDDYIQADLRLRGYFDNYYQIMFSFNPVSKLKWIYREFYEEDHEEAFYHDSTYKDNLFIDEHYRKRLERLVKEDENYYKIYALSEWGELRAIIYSNWTVGVPPSTDWKYYDYIVGGLDYGYHEPAAFVLVGIKDRTIYILDEIYQTGLTNPDFIDKVKERYIAWNAQYWDIPLYSDHEPDRIEEFGRESFVIYPAEKKVRVWNQIDFIKRFPIVISPDCPNLRKEIEAYKAREDRATGLILEEPVKFLDHALDAMRYAVYSLYYSLVSPQERGELILGGKSLIKGLFNA